MKDFLHKTAAFLRKTWVWSLCLVLLLALLIWFAGPLLAIAEHKFWATAASRLVSISGLFLAWGLFIVFLSWRANQRKKAAADDADAQERLRRDGLISEEQIELRNRFRQALRTLKSSSLYRGRSEKWRNELPWYLLLGPEGSGKTSLLDFSGLDFPLNRGDERRLTRNVGGTRYCDWYFADHAVLLDTTGRYLSQPDVAVDSRAWHTLLSLLRKRRARPLNGVLVNVPVDTLLHASELELETLARQIRQRLHELHAELRAEVPVYLVLSKTDKVSGFDEFFDPLSREESDQVLGASFRQGQNATDASVVRQEFEELLRRLNSQVIMRLHQERDTQRRGRILDFPQQLGQLGERLCLLVELAFSGNRYQRSSHLRGFYLTSAPQLQEQLDPSTTGIGRNLGLAGSSLPTYRSGRARFIHQLLSRVIFPEAELASLDDQEIRRIDWRQRGLYAGAAACLVLCSLFWGSSYSANHGRLEQLRELALQQARAGEQLNAQDEARLVLPLLDSSYAATRVFPADARLLERGGLYQGPTVQPEVHVAYRRQLEQELLPRVARQLEAQIRASHDDRQRLQSSLRAYLMLNLHERRDPAFLQDWLAADWSLRYAGDEPTQQHLNGHFQRLLAEPFAAYPLNDTLVAEARQTLRAESLAQVVYRTLREQARSLPEYRIGQALGPQAALLQGSDYGIPGLYTRKGYQRFFVAQGLGLVRNMLADNWVLGDGNQLSERDLGRLLVELEQLYLRDYANYWGEAVAQLGLEPIGNSAQGISLLSALTAANSPLLQVLVEVRDNTRFELPGAADQLAEQATPNTLGKLAASALDKGLDAVPDSARKALQRRFEPLHQLLDGNNAAGPELAATLQALDALQLQLNGMAHASAPEQAAFEMARARMQGRPDALNQLRDSAARLPQPVANWLTLLADDSWQLVLDEAYGYLNTRYRHELYGVYKTSLLKRYPFSANSDSDVAIADFREFFKADGVADTFVERYLKAFVSDGDGRYRLRLLNGQGLPLSADFLAQMNRTQVIRRSFFAENPAEPLVRFRLEPFALDYSLNRADFQFGGQQLEYRHGPIVASAFRWPADGASERSSLVLEEQGGRRVGIEQDSGPWALFRLLDRLQVEHHSGRDVLLLKANLDGLQAKYLLHSQRSPNPFDASLLRQFRLPVSL